MAGPIRSTPNPLLLEINTRVFLGELSRDAGRPLTLGQIPAAELDRIAADGFQGVWLMGIWTTGPRAREIALSHQGLRGEYDRALPGWTDSDVPGSPYAIARHEADPTLGGREELAQLRERLARRGLGLVLDFVPNHVGIDHPWLDEAPQLLVRGSEHHLADEPGNWFRHASDSAPAIVLAHGRDPHFPGWSDTCQIDFRNAEARQRMTAVMRDAAAQCDGLRCDMAMLPLEDVFLSTWGDTDSRDPGDFWAEAIPAVRRDHPELVLIAEAYWGMEDRLHEAGFDFAYDKSLLDLLAAGNPPALRAHLSAPRSSHAHRVHFLENHDEARAAAVFEPPRQDAATVFAWTLPGARLVHEGQADGRTIRVPVQLSGRAHEIVREDRAEFHRRVFALLRDPSFHKGTWTPVDAGDCRTVFGNRWTLDDRVVLVVVNLSEEPCTPELEIAPGWPPPPASGHDLWNARECPAEEAPEGCLRPELGPWEFRVLAFAGSQPAIRSASARA
ncbi:MAG: alpha-amylase family glycosyl hydrolase [Gemmatimonadota bacterium]|jgi:hypothetical protein|nr:alpha-amylase family glycosyl hydrolase [Gemmatimonadota bacterium]MDP6529968.1 alpha-amylase family glycosyl hydrolase [Gemmatimonadota bacterium]MDP6802127.1 alpha-amylase family glycosyl hydrolase [Gemmatimonadota bacterium]MDP7032062.1 alpha-amylase family glycosyl hydrolase [Gemmatimonadota bacterium]